LNPLLWGIFGPFVLAVAVAVVVGAIHLVRWLIGYREPDEG